MAPVVQALRARPERFTARVCLTAQHRELLDQVIRVFDVPVDHDLNLMRPDQTIYDVTADVVTGMRTILEAERPDAMLVHGDTTTSFAAALAGYYAHVPVGHVEAGLRTYDKRRPFPEEINRQLADRICDFHYAPTVRAAENLRAERLPDAHILITGNTVIDALLDIAARDYTFEDPALEAVGQQRRLLLVTAHRRESFGAPFESMCRAMRALADRYEDLDVVYPVHPNPNVQRVVRTVLADHPRIKLIEPLDYLPFVHLLKKATIVLTDSGGIQEEAPSLGKPVLVMRDVTERPEAVEAGTARLVGSEEARIVAEVARLLEDATAYAGMARAANPYGDGHAAPRIADHLAGVLA